jgi:hypothetical protein
MVAKGTTEASLDGRDEAWYRSGQATDDSSCLLLATRYIAVSISDYTASNSNKRE